jgi:hypothetical protein
MAKKHWMQAAFSNSHGQLHAALGVPKGQKIPRSKLQAAIRKGGVNAKRAQLVMNANPLR